MNTSPILLMAPLYPPTQQELESRWTVRRLFEAADADALLDELGQPGRLQYGRAVAAGGDHRDPQSGGARGVQVAHRARIGGHPVAFHRGDEGGVLPVGDGADGGLVDDDPARRQEGSHPVVAGPAVDEVEIVLVGERRQVLAGGRQRSAAAVGEEGVEGVTPGRHVKGGGRGEHTVEIEEHDGDRGRQSEHVQNATLTGAGARSDAAARYTSAIPA